MHRPCAWRASQLPVAEFAAEHTRDRELLVSAVREAGALALQKFRGPLKIWHKGAGKTSPVSEADIAVDEALRNRLGGAGYGWLSEESADDPARLDRHRVWIVDPIDGSRAYISGLPEWAISAALGE